MPRNKKIYFLVILSIFCGLIWFSIFFWLNNNFLKVVFFDVGQGDSIFIETINQRQVLIDGGPDNQILNRLNQEMPFWDKYIDLVVLTHPDADHITGLVSVLKYFKVGHILTSGLEKDTAVYQKWKELIKQKKIPISLVQAGQQIVLDNNISLQVLWPDQNLINQYANQANNASIVLKLVYQQADFLLPGDIEAKIERLLTNQIPDLLSADLLKAAHHGSKSSSLKEFIQLVDPQIVVVSVGQDNWYGHPHQEVLDRFKDLILLRTDLQGNIQVETDGQNIWLELEKKF